MQRTRTLIIVGIVVVGLLVVWGVSNVVRSWRGLAGTAAAVPATTVAQQAGSTVQPGGTPSITPSPAAPTGTQLAGVGTTPIATSLLPSPAPTVTLQITATGASGQINGTQAPAAVTATLQAPSAVTVTLQAPGMVTPTLQTPAAISATPSVVPTATLQAQATHTGSLGKATPASGAVTVTAESAAQAAVTLTPPTKPAPTGVARAVGTPGGTSRWMPGLNVATVTAKLGEALSANCSGPLESGGLQTWTCVASAPDGSHDQILAIEAIDPDHIVALTATDRQAGKPDDRLAVQFFTTVARMVFQGSDLTRAQSWLRNGIGRGGQARVGGLSLSLYGPLGQRVLEIFAPLASRGLG